MDSVFFVRGSGFNEKTGCGSSLSGSVARCDGENTAVFGVRGGDGERVSVAGRRDRKVAPILDHGTFTKPSNNNIVALCRDYNPLINQFND